MGTGWRRAFCTAIPRENSNNNNNNNSKSSCKIVDNNNNNNNKNHLHHHLQQQQQSYYCESLNSKSGGGGGGRKLGFFSNPSTPRFRSRQPPVRCNTIPASSTEAALISPRLVCNTTKFSSSSSSSAKSPTTTNPSSPRSPFAILKNTLRFSRSSGGGGGGGCGVCMHSVKTGQGMAIYTAECSHTFHFPCIASHVRKQGSLVCPVCHSPWKHVPLLAIHNQHHHHHNQNEKEKEKEKEIVVDETSSNTKQRHQQLHVNTSTTNTTKHHQVITKTAYNDDEPLAWPTAAKFNAILEAVNEGRERLEDGNNEEEEEEEEEIEEFKGFFVNPVSSSDHHLHGHHHHHHHHNTRNVDATLLPEAALVSVGPSHETYAVVLKLKAPRPPSATAANSNTTNSVLEPARRAPIDLVTVLDVSGSMSGAKLQMLKRAMMLVISSLGSADRLSIVAFSAAPKRLMPLRRMTSQGQRAARRIIDKLACSQGTSVSEALRKARKILEDRRERNPVASIMLLSDGQDEAGNKNVDTRNNNNHYQSQRQRSSSHVSTTRFGHVEIPVHSSGFGGGKSGTRYTRRDPPGWGGGGGGGGGGEEEDAFTKCVGGLLCVVVQDLQVQLEFAAGSDPAEISAAYLCNGRPTVLSTSTCSSSSSSSSLVRLGDFYAEEEREVLLEVRIPKSRRVGEGDTHPHQHHHHVLSVKCSYKDPATQQFIQGGDQALLVPRLQPLRSISSSTTVERLRNLFITTRAIAESRRFVEVNDENELSSAIHLLSSARALLLQSSSSGGDEYVKSLEAELAELQWRKQEMEQRMRRRMIGGGGERDHHHHHHQVGLFVDDNGEPLMPTSAWRAAEKLAKVAEMKKSMNRVGDLHGFENARF